MATINAVDLASKSPAELIAIIEAMARASRTKVTLKVSEKGALSVYGFGQYPVTLYKSQWLRLIESIDEIAQFIKDNAYALTEKQAKA